MDTFLKKEKEELKFNIEKFKHSGEFTEAMNNRWSSMVNGAPINGVSEVSLDIFEAEIIDILEKKYQTANEKEMLNWTKNRYIEIISNKPCLLIDSKLLKSPYYEKLFLGYTQEIKNYQRKNLEKAGNYYKKFIANEKLNTDEEVILFKYLSTNIDDNPEIFEDIFQNTIKKILELNGNVSIYGKYFLIKYIAYQNCKKLALKMPYIYISNIDLDSKQKPNYEGQYNNNGIITIDYDLLSKDGQKEYSSSGIKNITNWIHVIYHELKHHKQKEDLDNQKCTIDAWDYVKFTLLSTYLSKKDFKEYKVNYRFSEIEKGANLNGWIETAQFLNTYSIHFTEEIEKIQDQKNKTNRISKYGLKAIKEDDNYKVFGIERYNFEHISEIIKKNPHLLEEYKILNIFFDTNGIKDINRLLTEYSRVLLNTENLEFKRRIIEIYTEVFSYYFIRLNLTSINFKNFELKDQLNYFGIIDEIYQYECQALKDMIDGVIRYNDQKNTYDNINTSPAFRIIGLERIRRIKKYYYYLSSHMNYIQELKEKVPAGYIVYKDNLNLLKLGNGILSIINTEFKNTELSEEIERIPLIMDDETYESVMNETKEQTYGKRR